MARARKLPPGMQKRGKVYYAKFMHDGQLIRKRLSTDLDTAKRLLIDLRARYDRGNLLDLDYPYADLRRAFLRWAQQSVRHPEDYERDLKRFEEFTKPATVAQITAEIIDAYRTKRLHDDKKSPRTVNREVGTITNMLNKGATRFKCISHNPIAAVKPLEHSTKAKERRALTVEELQSLLDGSPDYLKPVWLLFMTTGIRKSELVDLRFSDVDFEGRTIRIRASIAKSRKPREIPLDDTAHRLLIELRDRASQRRPVEGLTPKLTMQQGAAFSTDHVFVGQANTPLRNNLLRRFYGIANRANIEGAHRGGSVDIHSLRVSFVTLAIEHGASPKAVQAIAGHSTLALTMGIYAKATDGSKRAAVASLPFAACTGPDHLLSIESAKGCKIGAELGASSENRPKRKAAK